MYKYGTLVAQFVAVVAVAVAVAVAVGVGVVAVAVAAVVYQHIPTIPTIATGTTTATTTIAKITTHMIRANEYGTATENAPPSSPGIP